MLNYALILFALVGFMTKADDHKFTTESQLASRYTGEIADFWQQGEFAHFSGAKASRINYAFFLHKEHLNPSNDNGKKCLVISPGRSEGYLKYKELSFDLFKLGFNVFLIDHRGQGLSERALANPHKGYVENFQYYVDDLATFIARVVSPHCTFERKSSVNGKSTFDQKVQKPYLLAHSMGGAIAARYMQDHPDSIQAAVLSSPMLGFNGGGIPDAITESLIKASAQLNQWLDSTPWYFLGQKDYAHSEFDDNVLMHSELRYQQFTQLYKETPAIQLGGVTIKWLTESIAALETLFAKVDEITTPTLVIQSGADKVISNQAQNDFCQQLHQAQPQSCPNGKPFVVKEAYHELFFERDIYRQQALTAVLEWFKQHPSTSSGQSN